MHLFYPQRPFSLVTGSASAAAKGAGANYNGHRVSVDFSPYRGWAATYHWGRLVWLASRTTFELALEAAEREYARGALGAETSVACDTAEQVEVCRARGYVTSAGADALRAAWRDARYDEVNAALEMDRRGVPASDPLATSTSVEEFRARLAALRARRHTSMP